MICPVRSSRSAEVLNLRDIVRLQVRACVSDKPLRGETVEDGGLKFRGLISSRNKFQGPPSR